MNIPVHFYSYFKELAGCESATLELREGGTIGDLLEKIYDHFPELRAMQKSTLVAVNVDYQPKSYVVCDGDQIALFPPVQGG